ncbi:MAG TPA: stage V sporulation protein D [Clostridiales bacterium]|nr:stage V sporulation protein D [Clostridiales bacterium]
MTTTGITSKKRLVFFLFFLIAVFIILIVRLGWIQIYQGAELKKMAQQNWTRDLMVTPKRGLILDRNGKVLAKSASADTVALRPNQIEDPEELARKLSPILDIDAEVILKKATDKSKSEIWLARQITREQSNKIRQLQLKGVAFTEESKRCYPNKNFASHILGFTGIDGQGLDGIEIKFDEELRGTPGKIETETDALGRKIPFSTDKYIPPRDGYDLVLTIDEVIQHFAEKAAENALIENKAKSVTAVVMDPNTGEILAMASKPDYDPNEFPPKSAKTWQEVQALTRNFAVSGAYEPGSTFKIITAAAALEEGAVKPNETLNCNGYKVVDGQRIRCWRSYNPHGPQTFVEGVQNSCNPVFMELAERLGPDTFYKYIRNFGFGKNTGIQLPGETPGIVMNQANVKPVDLARISFGQAIAVSPIQLITAVSAVANGGYLMQPTIVKELRDKEGNVVEEYKPEVIRQVISEETSDIMRDILESVVSEGSGRHAYIEGYKVAGKTGTAQKYEKGVVSRDKHVASFIAFAPADHPKIAVLVVIDEPGVVPYYGGTIAAPVVKQIMADTFKYLNIPPEIEKKDQAEEKKVTVPEVRGLTLQEAIDKLDEVGLQYLIDGTGAIVTDQTPKPQATVSDKSIVLLYLEDDDQAQSQPEGIQVPDLTGMSMREANNTVAAMGLRIKINGSGVVVGQTPEPGTTVSPGDLIEVYLEAPQ